MLRAKLFELSLSCFARKASDLPSWQIPFDVSVSPCFSRRGDHPPSLRSTGNKHKVTRALSPVRSGIQQ